LATIKGAGDLQVVAVIPNVSPRRGCRVDGHRGKERWGGKEEIVAKFEFEIRQGDAEEAE